MHSRCTPQHAKPHMSGVDFGRRGSFCSSTKQKLNTRKSTESKLVGVNDPLPQVLWARQFLNGQEYGDTDLVIYQDNQSAMLLGKHGRGSSGK